jgi:hypothetical protein
LAQYRDCAVEEVNPPPSFSAACCGRRWRHGQARVHIRASDASMLRCVLRMRLWTVCGCARRLAVALCQTLCASSTQSQLGMQTDVWLYVKSCHSKRSIHTVCFADPLLLRRPVCRRCAKAYRARGGSLMPFSGQEIDSLLCWPSAAPRSNFIKLLKLSCVSFTAPLARSCVVGPRADGQSRTGDSNCTRCFALTLRTSAPWPVRTEHEQQESIDVQDRGDTKACR